MWRSFLLHVWMIYIPSVGRHIIFFMKHGVDIYKAKELISHTDIHDAMIYAHMSTKFIKKGMKGLDN